MITHSQQQTIALGKKIAAKLKGGDILLLQGELGAGKTTLVKGIAKGFGIRKNITSPTFTLMSVYKIPQMSFPRKRESIAQLVHIDTYRLKDEKDLIEIGAEDYIGAPDAVCVIEWPEKIKHLLRGKKVIEIKIEHKGKKERRIITQNAKLKSQNCTSKLFN